MLLRSFVSYVLFGADSAGLFYKNWTTEQGKSVKV
jgi:hypothetical protein